MDGTVSLGEVATSDYMRYNNRNDSGGNFANQSSNAARINAGRKETEILTDAIAHSVTDLKRTLTADSIKSDTAASLLHLCGKMEANAQVASAEARQNSQRADDHFAALAKGQTEMERTLTAQNHAAALKAQECCCEVKELIRSTSCDAEKARLNAIIDDLRSRPYHPHP